MRWLSLNHELFQASLPCPAADLVALASELTPSAFEHPACCKAAIAKSIRMNPSLLLFSLNHYRKEIGSAPDSAESLVVYCESRLAGLIADSTIDETIEASSKTASGKISPAFQKFLDSKGNGKLQRALAKWIRVFSKCGRDDAATASRELVGDQLRADQILSEQADCDAVDLANKWKVDSDPPIQIRNLFRTLVLNQQMRDEFTIKVRDSKLAAMKGLAYGASHEINNPLANVATRAQTMLAIETDQEKRHKLAVIYEQAMRAHEMISDMMLFANPPRTEFSVHDLKELTRSIVAEIKQELGTCNIEILIRQYPDVVPVEIDPTQYAMAIKAIVKNSIEAIGSGEEDHGQVRIRFFRDDKDTIGISIVDDGPGVEGEIAEFMFDPFYSGREAGRGLGFGLSKAWRIMKLHQGDVFYDEAYERGAKIEFRIPISQKQTELLAISRVA